MLRDKSIQSKTINLFLNIFLAAVLIVVLMPIVFMLTASLMTTSEIFAMPFRWIPEKPHWPNYYNAIAGNDRSFVFIRNVMNSLIVAITTTVLSVFVSASAGYGLSKFQFRGQKVVFMMIMGRMMIPFEAIMIPIVGYH